MSEPAVPRLMTGAVAGGTAASVAAVYVLAGGQSRRHGTDKAFADEGGVPRTVAVSRAWERRSAGPVTAIARVPKAFAPWGLRTIADSQEHAGKGPLAGLLAALCDRNQRAGPGWVLLLACDGVAVNPSVLEALLRRPLVTDQGDADSRALAAVFRDEDGRRHHQPFPGLYHSDAAAAVEDHLRQGDRSMQGLLCALPAATVASPPGLSAAATRGNRPETFSG